MVHPTSHLENDARRLSSLFAKQRVPYGMVFDPPFLRMTQYTLWLEGYAVTGQQSNATCIGTFNAESYDDAVLLWADTLDQNDRKRHLRKRSDGLWSFWSCRIFDNEDDARKVFG